MIVKATIELEVDEEAFGLDDKSSKLVRLWFESEVMCGNGTLILHSNEVGDTVGVVKSVKNIQYIKK